MFMDAFTKTAELLSPVDLWRDFDRSLPLSDSVLNETVDGSVVYSCVSFYGRQVDLGDRVKIFGVFAYNKKFTKKTRKSAILIIPDVGKSIDYDLINAFVNQGYSVFSPDLYGKRQDGDSNYTVYPDAVSYANYQSVGRHLDYCDGTAKSTAWYEWVAVSMYCVRFLKECRAIEKIGVLGEKDGANVAWQLCGIDRDGDINCFVPLFGAGWRTYRGVYKYSGKEIAVNDERLRYLAGVDAHAYAQYVRCPVFYMTATNSDKYDCDRAMDTLARIPESILHNLNFSVKYLDCLDVNCKRNVDLFFANHLLGYSKAVLPTTPRLNLDVEDGVIKANLGLDFSDVLRVKKLSVYVSADGQNPVFRDWREMKMLKSLEENSKNFVYNVPNNCSFVTAFGLVEYRNGYTVCSPMITKKTVKVDGRKNNLLYSTSDILNGFSFLTPEKTELCGSFFLCDDPIEYVEGSDKICGVFSKYGLINLCFNDRTLNLTERNYLVFDANCVADAVLKATLVVEDDGAIDEFVFATALTGGDVWQKVLIKLSDFKNEKLLSVKKYDKIVALKLQVNEKCIFNNLLVV